MPNFAKTHALSIPKKPIAEEDEKVTDFNKLLSLKRHNSEMPISAASLKLRYS